MDDFLTWQQGVALVASYVVLRLVNYAFYRLHEHEAHRPKPSRIINLPD